MLDRVEGILRKKSIDGYELFLDQSSHFYAEVKDGKVDTFQASRSWGISIRVLKRQRMGFSYSTSSGSVQSDVWERVVEDAIASAEATSPDPCFEFAPPIKVLSLHCLHSTRPWSGSRKKRDRKGEVTGRGDPSRGPVKD